MMPGIFSRKKKDPMMELARRGKSDEQILDMLSKVSDGAKRKLAPMLERILREEGLLRP